MNMSHFTHFIINSMLSMFNEFMRFVSLLVASGSVGGGQWPVWGADRPGEDCQEDYAASADPPTVWALLCASPGRHRLTGEKSGLVQILMRIPPCLCLLNIRDTCLSLQVVKFSKTFELMSPLCNMDRDIRWSTLRESGHPMFTWTDSQRAFT